MKRCHKSHSSGQFWHSLCRHLEIRVIIVIRMSESPDSLDFHVKVLGIKSVDGFSAVALEMDLWGYGDTKEQAVEDLNDNIRMQISFAMQKNDLSLLERPAPDEYQEMYRQCMFKFIKQESVKDKFVKCLPFPNPSSFESNLYASA